jgi:hypothetical protein
LTVRAFALLGAGSAAIHQLRYAIGYGDAAPQALAAHGHGYLDAAFPGLATAGLIALAGVLMRLARGRRAASGERGSLLALWLTCAFVLAAVYGIQETLEGAGAVAGGGWIGLVLAIPAGLLVALGLRGADAAELRLRAPLLHLRVVAASAGTAYVAGRPPRAVDLRLGARAPPHPCVV